jgi:hypothetical protein
VAVTITALSVKYLSQFLPDIYQITHPRIGAIMTNTSTITNTYTVIVYGLGFWGCGNSHDEAIANARKYGRGFNPRKDYHRVFEFTEPVHSVQASLMGVQWEWADKQGDYTFKDINDKEQS